MHYIIARTLTALFGIGTVYFTYIIGKQLVGTFVGLLAAFFLALLPLHVKYSHYAHLDVPAAFFMTLTLWAALQLLTRGGMRWYIITGLLIGASAATHQWAAAIGIVLVFAHVMRAVAYKDSRLFAHLPLWLGVASIALGFFIASPHTILEYGENLDVYRTINKHGQGGDLGNTRPDILWPLYNRSIDWGISFTTSGLIWEFDFLLCVVAVLGFIFALYHKDWRLVWLIGVAGIVLYVVISGYLRLYALKRFVALAPFAALLSAYGLYGLWQLLARSWPRFATIVVFVIVATTSGRMLWANALFNSAYAGGSTYEEAVRWAEGNLPERSVVLQHTPIRLLNWDDPRFRTVRMDEVYANFNPDNPEVKYDRARSIEEWILKSGIEYVVMDSRIVDRYYDATSVRLYPETTASYQAFYDDVRTRGRRVYIIAPEPWVIAGSRIEIYDVRHLH
jgi:4-amino-4-deoxy-L-arabinose transferase-like glycosyltransferase